ncbi:MAG: hypothetical protein ACRCXY_11475 [Fusobacteriaceae bacterium]
MIYQAIPTEVENKKTGETVTVYQKGAHIGYLCAISTYLTYKSNEFKDVSLIYHEEYNEPMNSTYRGLYQH